MKFYRWFEGRLSGRKSKSKSRSKRCEQLNDNGLLVDSHPSSETKLKSGQRSIQTIAPPAAPATPLNEWRVASTRGASSSPEGDISPSSPSLALGTPSLGNRQRSRIKTNPWLRSPWLPPRTSYSTSSSTDSGCITLNTNDCTGITAPNSVNFGFSSTSIDSNAKCDLASANRNPAPCSSSDEFVSSASSSSVFSSRSSSISSEANSDANWSTLSHPSAISLLSSEAIPLSPWSFSQASSSSVASNGPGGATPATATAAAAAVATKAVPPLKSVGSTFQDCLQKQHQQQVNQRTRKKFAQTNKRRFLPIYSKYSRFDRNEEWVSMATDLISLSSSEDELDSAARAESDAEERHVPSPAPPEPPGVHYASAIEKISSLQATDEFWDTHFRTGSQNNVNNSEIIESLIRNVCTSSPAIDVNSQFTPVSPLTADSGLGLSEGSISTTPSAEDQHQEAGGPAAKGGPNFADDEMNYLNAKIARLRLELKDIVSVAVKEARKEELRMREERFCYLREMIEFKRLLLIQSLDELRHRLRATDFY